MKELFEQIKSLNILVLGDVMLDRYVIGRVSRISPGLSSSYCCRKERSVAGGAANVSLNLSSLGASVETIGWFGRDESGEELLQILSDQNIEVDSKFRFSSMPTISKTRVTASNQQICRVDREAHSSGYLPNLEKSEVH